jgi:aryl-alcohol dehydrogenase-like predicted oxidoreductase
VIDEGKVRYGGLSNHPTNLIERALKVGPVVSSQNQYNPLQRRAEREIFPFCLEHQIGVLGWGSLSEGILAENFDFNKLDPKDFRRRQDYSRAENYSKVETIRQAFRQVAKAHGGTMVQAVIAWELIHPALTGAIIGVRNENEASEMTGGTNWRLTSDEMGLVENALKAWDRSNVLVD